MASVIVPDDASTAASAVGPSSHGAGNTRWSLTARALKPSSAAVAAYRIKWSSVNGFPPKSTSGRCTPTSTAQILVHRRRATPAPWNRERDEPDEPDDPTAFADDGMAPLINNTGADGTDDDDVDASSG